MVDKELMKIKDEIVSPSWNHVVKDPLTAGERTFATLLENGFTVSEAYKNAFPVRCKQLNAASIRCRGYYLANSKKIQKRRLEIRDHFAKLAEDAGHWRREDSIKTIKEVIESARKEHDRIELGYELEVELYSMKFDNVLDEIVELEEQIKDCGEKAELKVLENKLNRANREKLELLEKFAKLLKTKGIGRNTVQAMLDGTKILNEMQGYTADNVNMDNSIIFEYVEGEEVYE